MTPRLEKIMQLISDTIDDAHMDGYHQGMDEAWDEARNKGYDEGWDDAIAYTEKQEVSKLFESGLAAGQNLRQKEVESDIMGLLLEWDNRPIIREFNDEELKASIDRERKNS